MHVDEFPDLDRQLAPIRVPMVFGHLGYVPTARGTATEGFEALLRLLRAGSAWVKLTAPYRLTGSALPYPDVDPFAARLVEEAPDRLVWGSDWPHVIAQDRDAERRRPVRHLQPLGARRRNAPAHPGRQPGAVVRLCGRMRSVR